MIIPNIWKKLRAMFQTTNPFKNMAKPQEAVWNCRHFQSAPGSHIKNLQNLTNSTKSQLQVCPLCHLNAWAHYAVNQQSAGVGHFDLRFVGDVHRAVGLIRQGLKPADAMGCGGFYLTQRCRHSRTIPSGKLT